MPGGRPPHPGPVPRQVPTREGSHGHPTSWARLRPLAGRERMGAVFRRLVDTGRGAGPPAGHRRRPAATAPHEQASEASTMTCRLTPGRQKDRFSRSQFLTFRPKSSRSQAAWHGPTAQRFGRRRAKTRTLDGGTWCKPAAALVECSDRPGQKTEKVRNGESARTRRTPPARPYRPSRLPPARRWRAGPWPTPRLAPTTPRPRGASLRHPDGAIFHGVENVVPGGGGDRNRQRRKPN